MDSVLYHSPNHNHVVVINCASCASRTHLPTSVPLSLNLQKKIGTSKEHKTPSILHKHHHQNSCQNAINSSILTTPNHFQPHNSPGISLVALAGGVFVSPTEAQSKYLSSIIRLASSRCFASKCIFTNSGPRNNLEHNLT